ncbi:tRNA uracil 4-sulfurtransferase ThiI [Shouchella shacheensis]|uniref:tRNA uracil 4-sulfurtransferase ThiI n=1 Tax=Shouchella shacheensis TaxID=1649580 RepID=UPI00073FF2AD|nr:tRNA uracil 4-sulfurtransferase ThiI [Shouchella shacheensis]
MKMDHILIRYGEIGVKGKNRVEFEKLLVRNIRQALSIFEDVKVKRTFGRIVVELHGQQHESVTKALANVFGIHSYSLALRVENKVEAMQKGAAFMLREGNKAQTFKVTTRRAYKPFPIDSQTLNREIGGYVLRRSSNAVRVDVHTPDVEINVEVRESGTYITAGAYEGARGLPVGASGKVLLMLSGGIDSPVAGHMIMKRGAEIEAIHFHSPPYTNERAKQKVMDLARALTSYGTNINLHLVPFTEIQTHIHKEIPSNYEMTIMRRMMMRIAQRIASDRGILAIATGESLGQVASQTLASMNTINEVTTLPVLRPLVTMDKLDVINYAKRIGTYEISILPYEDCCTIFLPPDSKTKPKREGAAKFEQFIQIEETCAAAVTNTETVTIKSVQEAEAAIDDLFN